MAPIQLHRLFLHWFRELLKDERMRRFVREQLEQSGLPVIQTERWPKR